MERLVVLLAVNGVIVLVVSLVAGLLLHRAVRLEGDVAAWHLAHAGGSGRGILLMALAPLCQLAVLPASQLALWSG